MAFKGPLVVAGWGYNTEGYPVPNASGKGGTSDSFASGYLTNSTEWKVGPVDLRWDDERSVWAAGGGTGGSKLVKVLSSGVIAPSGAPSLIGYHKVYKCQIADVSFDDEIGVDCDVELTDQYIFAGNFRNVSIVTDAYYVVHKVGGKYIIDYQADFIND